MGVGLLALAARLCLRLAFGLRLRLGRLLALALRLRPASRLALGRASHCLDLALVLGDPLALHGLAPRLVDLPVDVVLPKPLEEFRGSVPVLHVEASHLVHLLLLRSQDEPLVRGLVRVLDEPEEELAPALPDDGRDQVRLAARVARDFGLLGVAVGHAPAHAIWPLDLHIAQLLVCDSASVVWQLLAADREAPSRLQENYVP